MKRTLEVVFWCVVALVGVPVFAALIYTIFPKQSGVDGATVASDARLASENASDLAPTGELAEMFSFFSNSTQIQRDEKEREIKGKIVRWRLPVYNVSERHGYYVVQTKSRPGLVSTFCYVRLSDDAAKQYVLSLKENDLITCKGQIAGTSMRSIEIRPAVLQ
ncbi:hypothetical protein [Bradyrhizobium australiense]|uniref:tRNA_anti-like n=1 Tax=Bradyrhizobium australiense TaxID=2721161 RepID=A0A7Y4GR70_9BRAD|nr:hypothetical protein [Bradyrhizobium australiense]NOJ40331.1 hypothetical protein [Bradyrhizobium australiense]